MKEKETLIKKSIKRKLFDFEEFISHLSRFKEVHKNLKVEQKYICKDGYKLGIKVSNIRAGHIKLNASQIAKLNELGFLWNAKAVFDFDNFYSHLQEYKDEYPDPDFSIKLSYICKDGYRLGRNINRIRAGYIKLDASQIAKLEELDFKWDARVVFDFEKFYSHLKEYLEQCGDINIKKTYVCPDEYCLGQKISNIRWNIIKLTDQQKAELEKLGFKWESVKTKNFNDFCKHLIEFKQQNNHTRVPFSYVCADGYKLGCKVSNIRRGHIKLNGDQKAYLKEIGFAWRVTNDFDFEKFYAHFKEYKNLHPHDTMVKSLYNCEDGYKLGKIINRIRAGHIKLDASQIAKLNELGFSWDARVVFDFNKFYAHFKEYKNLHPHTMAKSLYVCEDGYKLGQAINNIRAGHIKLDASQRALLDELDFKWHVKFSSKLKNFDFDLFYNNLLIYKQKRGDCFVDFDYVGNNYELGFFVRNIRNRRIKLTDNQREKLEGLGFCFDTHEYYLDKPEEPLVRRMANGDISARNELIEKFMPTVHSIASRYKGPSDYYDLVGIGYDGLDKTLDYINEQDETLLKAYMKKTIKYKIIDHIKEVSLVGNLSEMVDNAENFSKENILADDTYRPDVEVENKQFKDQLLERVKRILNEDEFRLVCLRFGFNEKSIPYSTEQLAKAFSTTAKEVEGSINEILKKLETYLPANEWSFN